MRFAAAVVALLALTGSQAAASASDSAPLAPAHLTAGTGRASIDPPSALFPIRNNSDSPLIGIHDPLFARALLLDDGTSRAIVVVADLIIVTDELYEAAVTRLSSTYAVPRDRVFIAATHTHTVPWFTDQGYGELVIGAMVAAVDQARHRLEAVEVGGGSGLAFINMNRDEATPKGFILGQDPQGPSDKTVRVVGFFRSDGTPLAILANYAVHAVTLYSSNTAGAHAALVSADLPGVADRFVDEHYGERTQTLWTSGSAGDQNPILMSFYAEPQSNGAIVTGDLGGEGFALTERLGQALAREIIRVTDQIKPAPVTTPLRAAQAVVQCATKIEAAQQGSIRLSYVGIGPIDLLGVSGELVTRIDQHLRSRVGRRYPLVLTLTNGYSGYLADEVSYQRGSTFEVTKTSFAPGCVEREIVSQAARLLGVAGR